jgi:hypothetical protein
MNGKYFAYAILIAAAATVISWVSMIGSFSAPRGGSTWSSGSSGSSGGWGGGGGGHK